MKSINEQLQPLFARIASLVESEVMPLARQQAKDELLAALGRPPELAAIPRAKRTKDASSQSVASPELSGVKPSTTRQACKVCGEVGHNSRYHKRETSTSPKPAEAPSSDDEESGAVAPRKRGPKPAFVEPVVLSMSAVSAMLAADRERSGDAGGFVARADRAPSIVGHVDSSDQRETCPVHGWLGRRRFVEDGHASCASLDGETPCRACDGAKQVSAGWCKYCGGTGIDRLPVNDEPSHHRAPLVRLDPRQPRNRTRSHSIPLKAITRADVREMKLEVDALDYEDPIDVRRPTTRAECGDQRPCPFVSCKHHLYLDINPGTNSLKINYPDMEPWDLKESCSLDAADRGGVTLYEVGEIMILTRERIRQFEVAALMKLKGTCRREE